MKKNYVMKKLDVPKRVTLPNGRTFTARFRRATRAELPNNITMRRTYRNNFAKGARRIPTGRRNRRRGVQSGRGLFSFIKKMAKNPILKDIARTGAKYLPGLYQGATNKIKNKNLKKILQSDTATGLVNNLTNRIRQPVVKIV